MEDPLIVERDELLKLIEELERLCAGLQDVNAGVSSHWLDQLRHLRADITRARVPSKWQQAWDVALEIIKAVAAELAREWIETLTYTIAALQARRQIYEVWRVSQIPTRIKWAHAA